MKTILITGASSGFGEACAERFASAGNCRLILAARRVDRLDALKKRIDCPVHTAQLDVRDNDAVRAFVRALPAEYSAVDVLVNNAGLALGTGPANDADIDDWERMIDTNVKGLVYLTRSILPGMVERNSRTLHALIEAIQIDLERLTTHDFILYVCGAKFKATSLPFSANRAVSIRS